MQPIVDIYFIEPIEKIRVSVKDVKQLFEKELKILNKTLRYSCELKKLKADFNCIKFIGIAALCKTEADLNINTPPNSLYINKHKLDEVLTEFDISPYLWRLCHKYLAGVFQLVQVNKTDLIKFL